MASSARRTIRLKQFTNLNWVLTTNITNGANTFTGAVTCYVANWGDMRVGNPTFDQYTGDPLINSPVLGVQ